MQYTVKGFGVRCVGEYVNVDGNTRRGTRPHELVDKSIDESVSFLCVSRLLKYENFLICTQRIYRLRVKYASN